MKKNLDLVTKKIVYDCLKEKGLCDTAEKIRKKIGEEEWNNLNVLSQKTVAKENQKRPVKDHNDSVCRRVVYDYLIDNEFLEIASEFEKEFEIDKSLKVPLLVPDLLPKPKKIPIRNDDDLLGRRLVYDYLLKVAPNVAEEFEELVEVDKEFELPDLPPKEPKPVKKPKRKKREPGDRYKGLFYDLEEDLAIIKFVLNEKRPKTIEEFDQICPRAVPFRHFKMPKEKSDGRVFPRRLQTSISER